jgi:hypothetical protein
VSPEPNSDAELNNNSDDYDDDDDDKSFGFLVIAR